MKQGALTYNEETDRYRIRFNLTSYSSDLHCGQCFEVATLMILRKRRQDDKPKT